ncbi:DNA gyrase subunit B [Candidatus Johnevansia muelleri]|uniref:DNA gyrase subunit B n=1 Tax=Candidatus Johnevansia muelleri TaxID=1495769 RepID=A0A078KIB0_9GAMM|nr:DNA gyrase subunit B [Candidatus Evansia muelleri]
MIKYDSSSIQVLKGLDAVRKRPGMYIGDTNDGSGLHQMVFEIVDNSIDEALAGYCNNISIIIYSDESITVNDNGRGIPTDIHKEEGISAAEVIMTILHAGGKFDNNSYKISGGLHGVGISVVNALSEKLNLIIYRNGKIYEQNYINGKPVNPLKLIGKTKKSGTKIHFKPSSKIFSKIKFYYEIIEKRFRELSFLNPGIYIKLVDKRKKKKNIFYNLGGLCEFLNYLNKDKYVISHIIFFSNYCKKYNIEINFVMQWNNSYKENIYCYTNNIPQISGTHLVGFKTGLTRTINNYINNKHLQKKRKIITNGEDIREGLTAIISIKLPDPKFSSQIKDKLVSSNVKIAVEKEISNKFYDYLLKNKKQSKIIVKKIIKSAMARYAASKAREITRKTGIFNISNLPVKLSDCQIKDPKKAELYIVEGDSAGGSAKQSRDRSNQAILPIKGKILNVEKSNFDKILSSDEINFLISTLGCGIGKNFKPHKLRYHSIIIMTDADIDGSHIRTLLLTFFFRYMPYIIKKGYLFIAQPPLYKVNNGKNTIYLKNDFFLKEYLINKSINITKLHINNKLILGQELKVLIFQYINIFTKNNSLYYIINILYKIIYINNLTLDLLKNKKSVEIWINELKCKLTDKELKTYNFQIYYDYKNQIYLPLIIIKIYSKIKKYLINLNFIFSYDYFKINCLRIRDIFKNNSYILYNGYKKNIYNFNELINYLINETKSKLNIQRYKGLGEMNPQQLWETTMNPNKRMLLKITIKNVATADNIFNILMGKEVEPRFNFIKKYALFANINI